MTEDTGDSEGGRCPFRPLTRESLAAMEERFAEEQSKKKVLHKDKDEGPRPNQTLEEGRPLAAHLKSQFPRKVAAKPIEEIDAFYQNQRTFVVISRGKYISRFSATNALWILGPFSPIRRLAINILLHPLFSLFMIATILVNCLFMIMPTTPTLELAELIFIGIYTFEFVVKVMARGFVLQQFTYLRDPWNWLDVIVLVLAYSSLGFLSDLPSLSAIRVLKIVPIVPGLKTMYAVFTESAKNLRDVFILIMFSIFLFALLGLQIYMGVLTQKCIRNYPTDDSWGNFTEEKWSEFAWNISNWYGTDYDFPLCGNMSGAGACPPGYTCLQGFGDNPNYGYTSFDTFGWSLLSTIRLMTRDYWENLYHLVLRAVGPWHMLFFIVIILLGSFYLVNCLMLAVIAMTYDKLQKKVEEEEAAEEEAMKRMKEAALAKETKKRIAPAAPNGKQGNKESSLENEDGDTGAKHSLDNPFIEPAQHQTADDMKDVMVLKDNAMMVSGRQSDESKHSEYYFPTDEDGEGPTFKETLRACCVKGIDVFCVWDCCWPWVKFQEIVAWVVLDPFFELFIMLCIIFNTLFMALDHHSMNKDMEIFLRRGNYFFILTFTIEAILKIIALSPKHYFKQGWNRFDFTIVALSLLELGLEGVQGLSVLRSFRLLRVFRLAKWWPALNHFISSMGRTSKVLNNLTFILCIFIFMFSAMGMELFGRNYIENIERFPDLELPRWNFTDFMHSFMVVFRALCGEWIESMWDCMLIGDVSCIIFFLAVVVVGNLIVLNLFVALLWSNLGSTNKPPPAADSDTNKIAEAFNRIGRFLNCITCNVAKLMRAKSTNQISDQTPVGDNAPGQGSSNLRQKSFQLIENKFFKMAILATIILSSLALALEDIRLPERPVLQEILYSIDIIFTVIFFLEMLIKLLVLGFKKYFTNAWCRLDFIIVMLSVISLVATWAGAADIPIFRCIRMLRALRPLMGISRCEGLRIVVNMLVQSIPSIFKLLIVCSVFWLIFAIMGVQLFAGKFYKCVDENGTTLSHEFIRDQLVCFRENYTWVNSPMNFDNIGNSFLCLFQVATFKGWIQIMNDAIDSREVAMQPIRETNIYMYLYFVFFIIFGSFFTLSLFMVVIIDTFKEQRTKIRGSMVLFMTEYQKKYYNSMKEKESGKPLKAIPRPSWKPQAIVFDICTNKKFDIFITLVIGFYMLTMSLDHYQQTETFSFIIDVVDLIVILIFCIECLMKIFALRCYYFKDAMNVFDFVVVILSILGLVLSDLVEKYFVSPALLRIVRVARVGLVLRSVKGAKSIRSLLFTLAKSLPALFNICLLQFLITFIYAILGMSLFMHVKEEGALDDLYNFKTFGQSMILLFQVSTSAGWDGVLHGITNEEGCLLQDNEMGYPGDCGSSAKGIIFLLSYLAITFFIVVNMLVAVIFETNSQATEDVQEDHTDDDR